MEEDEEEKYGFDDVFAYGWVTSFMQIIEVPFYFLSCLSIISMFPVDTDVVEISSHLD